MGRTRTQHRLRRQGLAIVESLRPRRLAPRTFPLKWECAKKDFLAHLQRTGLGGGSSSALLVGGVCHYSHRLCELVGGLSQRLVLSGRPPAFAVPGWSARLSKKQKICYGMTSRSPSLTEVACSCPRAV